MATTARCRLVSVLACAALVASACSDDGGSAASTTAEATTTTVPAPPGPCGSTDAQLLAIVDAASAAAHEVQVETILSAGSMADEAPDDAEPTADQDLAAQRDLTDEATEAFLAAVEDAGVDEGTELMAAIRSADDRIGGIVVSRTAVDDVQVNLATARQNGSQLARSFGTIVREARRCAPRGELANELLDLVVVGGYKATTAELGALLTSITTLRQLSDDDREDLEQLVTEREEALALAADLGSVELKLLMRPSSTSGAPAAEAVNEVLATPRDARVAVDIERWRPLAAAQLDELRSVETALIDSLAEPPDEPCGADDGELVALVSAAGDASHQVRIESLLTAASMTSGHTDRAVREALDAQRTQTDQAAAAFVAAAGDLEVEEGARRGADLVAAIASAEERIDAHGDARRSIDEEQVAIGDARSLGAEHAWALLSVIDGARHCADGGALAHELLDLQLVTSYEGIEAGLDAAVAVVATSGAIAQGDRDEVTSLLAARDALQRRIYILASNQLRARIRSAGGSESEVNATIRAVLETPDGAPVPVSGEEWLTLAQTRLDELRSVELDLIDQLSRTQP